MLRESAQILVEGKGGEGVCFSPALGCRSGGCAIGGERDALYSSRLPLRSSSSASNADGSTLSDPRLDLELVLGQRAKMDVVRPPRGLNSPRTIHHSGRT